MKTLNDIVNEELIFERIIGFINDFKFSVDIDPHAESREARHDNNYITKKEIFFTLAKVAKDIRDDIDDNTIQISDRIQIIDKSRNNELNIICNINNDKNDNYIKLYIVTVMNGKMPTHDIKKIYSTQSNDYKVKDDFKLLKNEI